MYCYALEFKSGKNTTWGRPNKHTGRLSRSVELSVFKNRSDRKEWIDKGEITSDMKGNCREPVNLEKIRSFFWGLTQTEFDDHLYFKQEELNNKVL